jgi:GTPase involved in cell partitioning and DNA repair
MTIRNEFEEFDPSLLTKTEIILLTKSDLVSEGEVEEKLKSLKKAKKPVLAVSVYDEESLDAVRKQLLISFKQ